MSYVNNKITYRFFCSHSADFPEGDLDAIKAVISTLNNEESSANFEFRDMYTGQSDDNKTAASLIKEANRSDIFFRLIHEEYRKGKKETILGKCAASYVINMDKYEEAISKASPIFR